ncbi:MAG: isoprenylcysteine carboxylmethyltransferase family protein, partial [Moraxellaceae bacterium]|nr:isoprenylcysteine carboxylmethyltransferase family protein [Moraxellaceae bacterium]
LKFFFAPLMINWCWGHIADMVGSVGRTLEMWGHTDTFRTLFDASLFWACFQLILFIDTFLFTLGYIIETPRLKNRIVTVEPTFFGWFICLACYPPFNGFTSQFFEWHSSDFPNFETTWIHIAAGVAALSLMGIYSWASVALGFKASNLTNRGIISHGPYKYVRHPAYTAKNLAWWIGATPIIIAAFNNGGLRTGLYAFGCTAAWSCIYGLRAWTEERHLLMTDNGYAEYKKKVPYRFIPGVI